MKKGKWISALLWLSLFLTACGQKEMADLADKLVMEKIDLTGIAEPTKISEPVSDAEAEPTEEAAEEQEPSEADTTDDGEELSVTGSGELIVIDPGHQQRGNSEQEPIGPGAAETKAKVAGGTEGKNSGLSEYELTLMVSLKLQEELEKRGYTVLMTRTANDVNISNAQRATVANENEASVFVRIHANGSENTSANGAMTICQTASNPYNAALYSQSRQLSEDILDELVSETGCRKEYVWETDSMSGINWAQVPVSIVEIGYMTNPEEDLRMAAEEYQWKIATGIADGIEKYLNGRQM